MRSSTWLNQYLPTCRIPSEVCKSGGEPAVYLVQSQLTLGGFNHGLNKESVDIHFFCCCSGTFIGEQTHGSPVSTYFGAPLIFFYGWLKC